MLYGARITRTENTVVEDMAVQLPDAPRGCSRAVLAIMACKVSGPIGPCAWSISTTSAPAEGKSIPGPVR